jgi:Fe-S oxidoreductase
LPRRAARVSLAEAGRRRIAPDPHPGGIMAGFDYGKYFGAITPLADALRESPKRFWEPTPAELAQPHEYVLYLGCNVLRTVHLAESIVAVLRAMGVDFVTLGGPSNCCGIIHHRQGDFGTSTTLSQHTLDKFSAVQPRAVLTYCPSCHGHFDEQIPQGLRFDLPYLHVTEFIAERLAALPARRPVARRIGLHTHTALPQQRKDSAATAAILRAIPALEVVELAAGDEWGRACTPQQITPLGPQRYGAMVAGMFDAARAAGCDALVAVYHSCYRELLTHEPSGGLEVLNYVELLAAALELGPYAARYKALKLAGDPDAAYAELAPRAQARGQSLERLRTSLQTHFAAAAPRPGGNNGAS